MAKPHAIAVATRKLATTERLALYAQRRLALIHETEEVRKLLAEAIRDVSAEGMRQVDIVKATGYTREQVRLIVAGRTR